MSYDYAIVKRLRQHVNIYKFKKYIKEDTCAQRLSLF